MDKEYTEKQWGEEMKISSSSFCGGNHWPAGSCTIPCPQCGVAGFYGPRIDSDSKKYRACKFCGWWQEGRGAGRKGSVQPYRCTHFYCDQCKEYGWTMTDNPVYCSKHHEMRKIDWASDDPKHPFHKIKEQMDKIHQGLNFPSSNP